MQKIIILGLLSCFCAFVSPPKQTDSDKDVWKSLKEVCITDSLIRFDIYEFDSRSLTALDSSLIDQKIREMDHFEAIYPIRLLEIDSAWNALIFLGAQYDSDQLREFLAVATLSTNFSQMGSIEVLSVDSEWAGETTYYHSHFLEKALFELDRTDMLDCYFLDENQPLTGEIEKVRFIETYRIQGGMIQKQRSDTLSIQYCK